jgi:hypothetical protein
MQFNLYTALPVARMTIDGSPRAPDAVSTDNGWNVTTLNLEIPGQSTAQINIDLAGPLDLSDGYHLTMRTAPTVKPFETKLIVDEAIVEDLGANAGIRILTA